ncbi:MAG: DMT family transporter [Clostridia bacterium]
MKKNIRANLLLLLTALIWGVAFVAQDVAMDSLEPYAFNGIRMALAALALLPVVFWMDRRSARAIQNHGEAPSSGVPFSAMSAQQRKTLLQGGLCCGLMLTLGSTFQQMGIMLGTGAGKAGFVTALYIVLVPLLGLLGGKRVKWFVWLAVAISAVGLYLLCVKGNLTIEPSDGYLILGAFCFTGHILAVDHFSRKTDCVKMSCFQFFVVAVLCLAVSAFTEHPTWAAIKACAIPLIYAGVFSGAIAYTMQIIAQKDTDPTIASLIMSLESVFAVIAGWLILGDVLTPKEFLGCAAMLCGIVLAQWPSSKKA